MMSDCFPIATVQLYLVLRTLCKVEDIQSMIECSLACFIPAIPANLKFRLIKDILVSGAFGVTFSMVNEMIRSVLNAYTQNTCCCGAANPSEFYELGKHSIGRA